MLSSELPTTPSLQLFSSTGRHICVCLCCVFVAHLHIEGRRQLAGVGSLSAWVPGIGLGSSDLVTVAFTHEASAFPSH